MSFETVLSKICAATSVHVPNRRIYSRDFNVVKDDIYSIMKGMDPVFHKIASSPVLGGSYADNLKVKLPDEFDLVIQLKIPDHSLIDIKYAKQKYPGFVKLNVHKLQEKIQREKHNADLYNKLEQLVDEDGYLIQAKFHSWMQSIFESALNTLPDQCLRRKGKVYKLKRSIHGPAQTINVEVRNRNFSVDFVPALRFPTSRWYSPRPCPVAAQNKDWIAIPKPLKQENNEFDPNNLYWLTSFADQERYFIHHMYSLKPSIRLLKQLRDSHNITNLKSYYIKTAFLWAVLEKDRSFWMKSLGTVFLYGFEMLLKFTGAEELPFFWDNRFNMLEALSENQRIDIHNKLRDLYDRIVRCQTENPEELYDIFFPNKGKPKMK